MKIIVSCEDFYPSLGGAESWLQEVLPELAKKHKVAIHYIGKPYPKAKGFACYPKSTFFALKFPILKRTLIRHYLANMRWKRHLRNIVKQEKPDLIITQLMYTPATVDVAKENNIPVAVFLHTYEHFCPCYYKQYHPSDPIHKTKRCYSITTRLQEPFVSWLRYWHKRALERADLIVANSKYMADTLREVHNLSSKIVFPIIDVERYETKRKQEFITFINPIKAKGVEVFIEIAKRLQKQKFLVVGGVFSEDIPKVQALPNVTYLKQTDDMKNVYAKTRLLIAPSQWYEPFGRVALEAAISGIPSIVSNRGGLPEAGGAGSTVIDDVANVNEWIKAIQAFDNKTFYEKKSEAAREHALHYTKTKQMKKLETLLGSIKRQQRQNKQ